MHIITKAAPAVLEPFKERIVEFDETKHLLSFLGIEGGYMNLGFTHYLVSFKLDDIRVGKTLITSSLTYYLEQNFDGAQLLDEFLNLLRYYLGSVVKSLQKLKTDLESTPEFREMEIARWRKKKAGDDE
ncbi:hypothetical protein KSP39_PZI018464 [Platanthera zijinensis]|uniref:Uncharacterized protein n=1 Tax=Platanthera zijinensis TaxID=2320716 RepID=A0AAP0B3F8_9ASPA